VTRLSRGGKIVDDAKTTFGFRTVRFDPEKGLILNGSPLKIQGTCNHQDLAGIGIAVPDNLEYWRVAKLKELGANAWRMSHNPPTPSVLEACDRLGMLVMDENRHIGDSPAVLGEVAEMVHRDLNHPSIIMWSMCNEEPLAGTPRGREIFQHMRKTVLDIDKTRPVTSAMNSGWFGQGFNGIEDLMGVNYNYEVYDRFHKLYPSIPLFGSETASTLTTRGEYADDKAKVFVSSYNMTDDSWAPAAQRPFVAGTFVWTGFDYKGEPTPYAWPDINSHFGILDMCGFPKDNYYYYQAWWKAAPMVHVMPHWNWAGRQGQAIKMVAFSNAAQVDLLINGRSQGKKAVPRFGHVEWTARYQPGKVEAVAYDKAGKVVARDVVETAGEPAAIAIKTDDKTLSPDGEEARVVEVDVVDSEGRIVPTAGNKIHFEVEGVGHLLGVGNGNPGDHDPDKAHYRNAFNGKCMAVIGGASERGETRVRVSAIGLKPAEIVFKS
jgi:beta-galactosidase